MAIWTITGTGMGGRLSIDSGLTKEDSESLEILVVESLKDNDPSQKGLGPDDFNSSIIASDAQPTLQIEPGEVSQKSESLSDSIRLSGANGNVTGTAFVSSSLDGRTPKNRAVTGERNGATPASEAAVEAALAYLARHQRNNG